MIIHAHCVTKCLTFSQEKSTCVLHLKHIPHTTVHNDDSVLQHILLSHVDDPKVWDVCSPASL